MKALVAACGLLVIAACGPLHPLAAASESDGTIPWLPLAANLTPAPEPTPQPVPVPPGTPACTAGVLQAEWMASQGATGNVITSFAFSGKGSSDCFLNGTPGVTLLDSTGRALDFKPRAPYFPPTVIGPVLVGVAPLPPAHTGIKYGQASLTIDWVSQPEACSGQAGVSIASARIDVPGGGALVVAVGAAPQGYPCAGVGVDPFEGLAVPASAPPPPPVPAVKLSLPGAAIAGKSFSYIATLTNDTGAPMDLAAACPNYEEEMFADVVAGGPPLGGKHFYALNCAPAGTLAPGASKRFQMIFNVPADAKPGTYTLIFALGLGNASEGDVETPVQVRAH